MKIILIALVLFLAGCGDTISQSSTGGGGNCSATGKGDCGQFEVQQGDDASGDAGTVISRNNPENCPVQPPVHLTCSVASQLNCVCVLP